MSIGGILFLAFGLAMDATAVAAARGLTIPVIRARQVLLVAAFFGGSQALMPVAGWLLGSWMGPFAHAWAHWIAFALLAFLGGKMLLDARQVDAEPTENATVDPFALGPMFVLAIATSLDAFAVGITLPLLNAPFLLSVAIIGVVTALLSVAGLFAGRRFGALLGKELDVVGGLILIGLGIKILLERVAAW